VCCCGLERGSSLYVAFLLGCILQGLEGDLSLGGFPVEISEVCEGSDNR
jgi:hypothetical protein